MIVRTFDTPVTLIREGASCEINNLWQALSFLRAVPVDERSPQWKKVTASCESALTGAVPTHHARRALEIYAAAKAMVPVHLAAERLALAI